jgi:hypothetical protein
MMEEREIRIQQLPGNDRNGPQQGEVGWACGRPDAVGVTDLIEFTLGRAGQELSQRVENHTRECPFCQRMLALLREAIQPGDVAEPQVSGSVLELAARQRDPSWTA